MQLSLKFVTGLLLASSTAFASQGDVEVDLHRRNSLISTGNQLNIQALSQHLKVVNTKYQTAIDNFKRNMGTDHPLLSLLMGNSISKRAGGQGSVPLTDVQSEQLWAGKVAFGGQSFGIDFDTGSSDTLVNPSAYHPGKSSSAKNTHQTFSASYGDGTTAKGTIYTDNLSIAGLNGTNVAIGHSTTTFISGEEPSEGIAGLGFPAIQTFPKQYKPFFLQLKSEKALKSGVFQFTLKPGTGSTLTLGGIDTSKYKGAITYVDVDPSQGFWLTSAKVNGQGIKAIIDSGSTVITGPTSQVRSAVSKISGLTAFTQDGVLMYYYDCNMSPSVTFNIGGTDFKLGKNQLSYGTTNTGKCVLPIVGQDGLPLNAWIVGDTFFQAVSVIFDTDQNRMGFATQA